MKQFALVGIDGEVYGIADTRQEVLDHIAEHPLRAFFDPETSVVEFDMNDSPITEVGISYRSKVEELFIQQGVKKFRMNKQVGFYQLSMDDRWKMIYEVLTEPLEPFSFNDSRWKENATKVDNIDEWGLDNTLEVTPVT